MTELICRQGSGLEGWAASDCTSDASLRMRNGVGWKYGSTIMRASSAAHRECILCVPDGTCIRSRGGMRVGASPKSGIGRRGSAQSQIVTGISAAGLGCRWRIRALKRPKTAAAPRWLDPPSAEVVALAALDAIRIMSSWKIQNIKSTVTVGKDRIVRQALSGLWFEGLWSSSVLLSCRMALEVPSRPSGFRTERREERAVESRQDQLRKWELSRLRFFAISIELPDTMYAGDTIYHCYYMHPQRWDSRKLESEGFPRDAVSQRGSSGLSFCSLRHPADTLAKWMCNAP
ncbi:uncharacterized protein N7459_002764 [Penicillium hispanicum]|uniref:uncharacterized protein n=1 Tax=Penicillium hispanicum TaxID=1080232 RepID=UPI002540FCED|nr:uncharacterized protein N7459_002764 [Penicillium hispanicum]KAJ5586999.1 hypothetical protein N7459_002764 [Penicillium hispanicum]